jgi:hypothetical protein
MQNKAYTIPNQSETNAKFEMGTNGIGANSQAQNAAACTPCIPDRPLLMLNTIAFGLISSSMDMLWVWTDYC